MSRRRRFSPRGITLIICFLWNFRIVRDISFHFYDPTYARYCFKDSRKCPSPIFHRRIEQWINEDKRISSRKNWYLSHLSIFFVCIVGLLPSFFSKFNFRKLLGFRDIFYTRNLIPCFLILHSARRKLT